MPKKQKRQTLSTAAWTAIAAIVVALIGGTATIVQAFINRQANLPQNEAQTLSPSAEMPTPLAMVTSPMGMSWTRYEKPADKFSIGLPSSWQVLDVSPQGLANIIRLYEPNPNLDISNEVIARMAAMGIKFYAIPTEAMGKTQLVSMNIAVIDTGLSLPQDVMVQQYLQQVEKIATETIPITHQTVIISDIEAEEFNYSGSVQTVMKTPVELIVKQYLFRVGTKQYALTFGSSIEIADSYNKDFEEIAKSFLLIK